MARTKPIHILRIDSAVKAEVPISRRSTGNGSGRFTQRSQITTRI
ncbi:MAG: hypothetical protein WBA90_03495 [Albidovulum sp.]